MRIFYHLNFQIMAIIKRGILGGFSNKIANVVGSSWKGIAVMRALPLSVANPQTPKQQAQRGKFSTISTLGSDMLSGWIKPLWDRQSKKMSGYNNFVSNNIKFGDYLQDVPYAEMVWSKGILPRVGQTLASVNGNNVYVQWLPNISDSLESPDDLVYIAIIRIDDWHVEAISSGMAHRRDQEFEFKDLADSLQGTYVVLVAFANADGSRVSETAYSTFSHEQ